uniref:Uncharacterized protein n=1 Tax=Ditylenchus dipsaci TaxID=166011 RepID=A0A915EV45_9BILA
MRGISGLTKALSAVDTKMGRLRSEMAQELNNAINQSSTSLNHAINQSSTSLDTKITSLDTKITILGDNVAEQLSKAEQKLSNLLVKQDKKISALQEEAVRKALSHKGEEFCRSINMTSPTHIIEHLKNWNVLPPDSDVSQLTQVLAEAYIKPVKFS